MEKIFATIICAALLLHCGADDRTGTDPRAAIQEPSFGPCEDCALMFEGMPAWDQIPAEATLAGRNETGGRLLIEGRIVTTDGHTPAPDVVLYAYHTDATGRYRPFEGQRTGRRHGRLRGWVKTGADGRFRFETIRPAAYPNGQDPAHIHLLVKEQGKDVYWIDDIVFDDDPRLTPAWRERYDQRGGDHVVHLEGNADQGWTGSTTIILGRNVPGYR